MSEDLSSLARRVESLEAESKDASREVAEARRLLNEARTRARLPVLDNIRVASPCKADWNQMIGDEHARFCKQCEKNVYNLSSMTRAAAEALLIEKEGKLCVRYYQRADGTILTADCPDGVERRRRKIRILALGFGAMGVALSAYALLRPRAPLMGAPPPIAAGDGPPRNVGVPLDPPIAIERPTMGEAPIELPPPKAVRSHCKLKPPKPPSSEGMKMGDVAVDPGWTQGF